jgi:hypothetical protein
MGNHKLINPATGYVIASKTGPTYRLLFYLAQTPSKYVSEFKKMGVSMDIIKSSLKAWTKEVKRAGKLDIVNMAKKAKIANKKQTPLRIAFAFSPSPAVPMGFPPVPPFAPPPLPMGFGPVHAVVPTANSEKDKIFRSACLDEVLDRHHLIFNKFLGSGVYGSVYMACTSTDNRCEFVVKLQKLVLMSKVRTQADIDENTAAFKEEFDLARLANKKDLAPTVYEYRVCQNVIMDGKSWLVGISIMEKWDMDLWKAGAAGVALPSNLLMAFGFKIAKFFNDEGIENSDGLRGPNLLCRLDGKLVTKICIGDWGCLDRSPTSNRGDCFPEWTKAKRRYGTINVTAVLEFVKEMGHPNLKMISPTPALMSNYRKMTFSAAELNKKAVYG